MASSVLSMSLSASLASKSKVFSSKTNKSLSSNRKVSKITTTVRATGTMVDDKTGIKKMRDGIKEAADENLLTPRFYTTGTRLYYYLISCILLCLLLLHRGRGRETASYPRYLRLVWVEKWDKFFFLSLSWDRAEVITKRDDLSKVN